jgi:hypothetical protein
MVDIERRLLALEPKELSMRTDVVRNEATRLLRQAPFRPFALNLENGDRIIIEHPENIAFDPGTNGSTPASLDFYVISRNLRFFGTFEAVSSVALMDRAE